MEHILTLASQPTPAGRCALLGVAFLGAKIAATVAQVYWMRGNYREVPPGASFKFVYWAGKITPSLACASFAVAFYLHRDMGAAAVFGGLAVLILALALYVVRLRKQGRFYGLADRFTN